MATVKIIQRTDKKNAAGECPLYLRIYVKKKAYKKIDIYVPERDWNPEKSRIRKSHGNYKSLNRKLQQIKGEAQLALNNVTPLTAKNVKAYLEGVSHDSFYEYA